MNPNSVYGPSTAGTQGTGRADGRNGARGTGAADGASFDHAEISSDASLASRVLSRAMSAHAQRVAELQNQVRAGTYQIDPQKLTSTIVNQMLTASQQE